MDSINSLDSVAAHSFSFLASQTSLPATDSLRRVRLGDRLHSLVVAKMRAVLPLVRHWFVTYRQLVYKYGSSSTMASLPA